MTTLEALDELSYGLVALTSLALAELTDPNLTLLQWRILVVLGMTEAGLRVSDLASRIAASGPSTSRLAQRLERRGLVETAGDARDRRVVVARLTARGREVRDRVVERRRELIVAEIGQAAAGRPWSADLVELVAAIVRAA